MRREPPTALRRVGRVAIAAALIAFSVYQWQMQPPSGTAQRTLEHAGRERSYLLHPGPPGPKTGLLLVLHGSGGRGRMIERRTGFDDLAEQAGVVTAYPDGVDSVWNDGWRPDSTVDDVGFLTALARALVAEFNIDPARVYATGFSNGGGMVHRLACESDSFAAIAPVGGYPPVSVFDRCPSERSISVLNIHGTGDRGVSYEPLAAVLERWAALDGCTFQAPSALSPGGGEMRVRMDERSGCRDGARVVLYSIEGGGHSWPGEDRQRWWPWGRRSGELDASAVILDFFLKTSRPPKPAAP